MSAPQEACRAERAKAVCGDALAAMLTGQTLHVGMQVFFKWPNM